MYIGRRGGHHHVVALHQLVLDQLEHREGVRALGARFESYYNVNNAEHLSYRVARTYH